MQSSRATPNLVNHNGHWIQILCGRWKATSLHLWFCEALCAVHEQQAGVNQTLINTPPTPWSTCKRMAWTSRMPPGNPVPGGWHDTMTGPLKRLICPTQEEWYSLMALSLEYKLTPNISWIFLSNPDHLIYGWLFLFASFCAWLSSDSSVGSLGMQKSASSLLPQVTSVALQAGGHGTGEQKLTGNTSQQGTGVFPRGVLLVM